MSDHLIFMMGEFEAKFPSDRQYCSNHMWAIEVDDQIRFGFTAYAVRLLQDVYFLDWLIDAPVAIQHQQEIGSIESKKAESDLFSPVAGEFITINDAALTDPSIINADPYGEGWLIDIKTEDASASVLLDPDGYAEHLVEAWDVAQRTIKGQANN